MKKIFILLLVLLSVVSCKTKMNQYIKDENKVSKRDGKWKEEYSSDDGVLTAIGKYDKGEKKGVWKTYFDTKDFKHKLYQKDKIKKGLIKTRRYFPNGKIMEEGQSKLDISKDQRHWYYFGDWKYYNDKGELLYIKKYHDGKKADSISYKK